MQDLQLKVKQRELEVESVAKARDLHKFNSEKLTSQLTELMAKKESAERDLFSKTELLRTVEEHHMIYIRKLTEDMKALRKQRDWEQQGKQMEIEDLRSYTRNQFIEFNKTKVDLSKVEILYEKEKRKSYELQDQLSQTTAKYEELTKTYAETSDRLKDSNDHNYELETEIKKLKDRIEDLELDIKALKEKEEKLRQVQAQNFLLQEKVEMLEKHIEGAEV